MISSPVLLDTATTLLSQERYKKALDLLEQCKPNPLTLWRKGQAWLGIGNPIRAIRFLNEAYAELSNSDARIECAIDLAIAYVRSGKLNEASNLLSAISASVEQQGNQRLRILHKLGIGYVHARAGKPSLYLEIWQEVEPQLLALNLKYEWLIGMTAAAFAHLNCGNLTSGLQTIEVCLDKAQKSDFTRTIALLSYRKVLCQYNSSNSLSENSITHLLSVVAKSDALDLYADSLFVKGIYFWSEGDWTHAERAFREAHAYYADIDNFLDAGVACIGLARIAFDRGDYVTALEWVERVTSRQTNVDSSHWVKGWIGLIQGWIHVALGNTGFARTQFEAGWSHFAVMPQIDLAAFCALQIVTLSSASPIDAQLWLERATALTSKSSVPAYQIMGERVRGEHLLATGDAAAARIALAQVLSTSETAGLHPEWVRAAAGLIECDLALAHTPADWAAVDERAATYLAACAGFPEIQARIAFVRAEAARASGNAPAALAHLHTASQHIRWMRSLAGDPALSGAIAGNFEPIYQRGAAVAIGVGDLPLAVEFAESRRAQHLAQRTALHPTPLQPKPDPTQPVHDPSAAPPRQDYTGFAERRRSLQSALHGVWFGDRPSAEQTAKLNQALEQQRQAYDALNAQAMARAAHERGGPVDVLDVPGLRAAFNQRFGPAWTAVQIEPVAGESAPAHSGDAWWLMVLTPDDLIIELIQPKTPIDRQSVQWLTNTTLSWRSMMLARPDKDAVFRRASTLLQVERWLPNVASPEHTLIFAGCEPFTHLPLPALLCADGHRLSERVVLRHAPSWNVAAHLCTRRAPHSPDRLKALLIAPVSFGGRYPDLPASLMEIEALKALWPDSDTLLEAEATVEALNTLNQNQALKSYDVVHFATHVEFDAEWSRISGIALHNGDLWLQDLLDWQLEAGLVCVSGCEAGRGSPVGGEESLGIEAAFIAAGARNVLSPEWHVRDTFAGEFISAVMKIHQHTDDVGLALTHAQRTFARTHSMLDWAAWRVFGMS